MEKFEDILDIAISELRRGSSPEDILLQLPDHREELAPLMASLTELSRLPKTAVPRPLMQRRYAAKVHQARFWNAWFNFSRFAGTSAAVFLIATALGGTAYAAWGSLPGQTLFPLKKTAEQIQLHFATNDADKAAIQVNITKKRLAEAQEIFKSMEGNTALQSAALKELSSQTQATVQAVKTAAASSAMAQNSHPITASLEDISQKQQALLSQITTDKNPQVAENTGSAAKDAKEIKQIIQLVAASNDPATLAPLNSDPSTVSISGTLKQVSKTSLSVEHTMFTITPDTLFKDTQGASLQNQLPAVDSKVTVVGNKEGTSDKIYAKEVVVLLAPPAPATTTAVSTRAAATTSPSSETERKPQANTAPQPQPESAQQQAVGTFIPEDPAPQFK